MNDRTIFCLGARSHYENPTSDLLKFFFDPTEEHGLGPLFIQALASSARLDYSYDKNIIIKREFKVDENKRLDLLIEGPDSILIIENKHWSSIDNNPLQIYQEYGLRAARDSDNKNVEFLVLAFDEIDIKLQESHKEYWKFLKYEDFINEVAKSLNDINIRNQQTCRWRVITDEFVNHLRLESNTPEPAMVSDWLKALRTPQPSIGSNRLNRANERITLYASSYLRQNLRGGEVRVGTWDENEEGHGWSGGTALDFQVCEDKSSDTFISLAIQTAELEWVNESQLRLIVWVKRPLESRSLLEQLESSHNFAYLDKTRNVKWWEEGIALQKEFDGSDLKFVMDDLIKVYDDSIKMKKSNS